jgi:hypothetical protein
MQIGVKNGRPRIRCQSIWCHNSLVHFYHFLPKFVGAEVGNFSSILVDLEPVGQMSE